MEIYSFRLESFFLRWIISIFNPFSQLVYSKFTIFILILAVIFDLLLKLILTNFFTASGNVNLSPVFTQDMNNLALSESTPLNSIVYTLEGYDPEGGNVTFGVVGSEHFDVNPQSGEVRLIKALDREVSLAKL